jgi:hypothetical protein
MLCDGGGMGGWEGRGRGWVGDAGLIPWCVDVSLV